MAIQNPKGPHHVEHETGGVDALVTLDGSIILTGTIPDARHSANIPRLNQANVFTVGGQEVSGNGPVVRLRNTIGPANTRAWQLNVDGAGILYFVPINDDNSVPGPFTTIGRSGDLKTFGDYYEKNRTTPMGHWITVPFSAGNFATDAGTLTIVAGNVVTNMYTLIGKTALWIMQITGATLSAGVSQLRFTIPSGLSILAATSPVSLLSASGNVPAHVSAISATVVGMGRGDSAGLTAGSLTAYFTAIVAIA